MSVSSWWWLLCAVAAMNIAAWVLSTRMLARRRDLMPQTSYAVCRRQAVLAAVYVFGCAFRSALPVFDIPRLCLFDTWLSSAFVGRSVATAAELCFVAQWALLLRETAAVTGSSYLRAVSHVIVPLIGVAEVCSWYSVLTTANIGHVIEETLWGVSATLIVVSLAAFKPRCPANWQKGVTAVVILGTVYAAYMFTVDVPMYWHRWLDDQAHGRVYLSVWQGLTDTLHRRVVSHDWNDWKSEVIWMSLYFSLAVWISIALMHIVLRKPPRRPRFVT